MNSAPRNKHPDAVSKQTARLEKWLSPGLGRESPDELLGAPCQAQSPEALRKQRGGRERGAGCETPHGQRRSPAPIRTTVTAVTQEQDESP